ncbi:hypothetical protein FRC11_002831 [Ceratobasidium sp. 423]|nr:hypothetical protein FRC11_002831 [Ceratobasidium sp. 423]
MIYRTNALSLSLLLGAGGVAISTAASLPYHEQSAVHYKGTPVPTSQLKAVYKQRSRFRHNATQAPRSILDDLTSSPDDAQDDASDNIDSDVPDPQQEGSPADIDLNGPLGSVTGWLNHEGRIYSTLGLEGELNLIAHSDEKPKGIKVGALGYASGSSAHIPVELLSETEAGGLVFLALPEPATDQTAESLNSGTSVSNNSMAVLVTRSTSLDLGLIPGLNLSGAGSADASGATDLPGLVHVLIKAGSPSSSSSPETLCATFYTDSARNRTDDDGPMFLERCDNSFIPGRPTSPASVTITQLWQYDPKTNELRPILQGEPGMNGESASKSDHPIAFDALGADRETIVSQPFSTSIEGARTVATQLSTATQRVQGYASYSATRTTSSGVATPSQVEVRRSESGRMGVNVSPAYMVAAVVEPYALVFIPRAAPEAGTTLPDSPV